MRYTLAVLLLSTSLQAQTPIIGPGEGIAFDYRDVDRQTYAVTHFEGSWDNSAFSWLAVQGLIAADTPLGSTTYRIEPPFVTGTHTIVLRACRLEGCGGGSSPFAFAYAVLGPVPPTGLRVVRQ